MQFFTQIEDANDFIGKDMMKNREATVSPSRGGYIDLFLSVRHTISVQQLFFEKIPSTEDRRVEEDI